jgi:hypothetical protein
VDLGNYLDEIDVVEYIGTYADGLACHTNMVGKLLDGEPTVGQSKSVDEYRYRSLP